MDGGDMVPPRIIHDAEAGQARPGAEGPVLAVRQGPHAQGIVGQGAGIGPQGIGPEWEAGAGGNGWSA